MANAYLRSRRVSTITRQSSTTESIKPHTVPPKVLVFTGKCSEIFKSTLEECVEDCILQFPGEAAIYVPKVGPALPLSTASRSNSIVGSKDTLSHLQSLARLQRRRSSTNPLNSLVSGSTRTHQASQFSLPTVAMAATSATRIRHQLVPQKFSFSENISEETSDVQTTIEVGPTPTMVEVDSEHVINHPEETISHPSNFDALSQSISCSRPKLSASPAHLSYRDRQKDYRLSDLVMLGPEHYAHVFNLSRPSRSVTTRASTRQQRSTTADPKNKTAEKYDEFDQIKQDLFHRYLWTQKPQVSCRIRPSSTYTRSTTFVLWRSKDTADDERNSPSGVPHRSMRTKCVVMHSAGVFETLLFEHELRSCVLYSLARSAEKQINTNITLVGIHQENHCNSSS